MRKPLPLSNRTHIFWHLRRATASWYLVNFGLLVPNRDSNYVRKSTVDGLEMVYCYNCKVHKEQNCIA